MVPGTEATLTFKRFPLVDAPLSPFRTHGRPAYSDQADFPDSESLGA